MNFWELVKGGLTDPPNPIKGVKQLMGKEQFQNPMANQAASDLRNQRLNMDTLKGAARGLGELGFGATVSKNVDQGILGDIPAGTRMPAAQTGMGGPLPQGGQSDVYVQMLKRMMAR